MTIQFGKQVSLGMREYAQFSANVIGLTGDVFINLSKDTLQGGSYGLCWGDTRPVEIMVSARSDEYFLSYEEILVTIGHELVHANQYLTGQLIPPDDPNGFDIWRGVEYRYLPEDEVNMPWEIEAVRLEREIYEKFVVINNQHE